MAVVVLGVFGLVCGAGVVVVCLAYRDCILLFSCRVILLSLNVLFQFNLSSQIVVNRSER